ncbi:unnamed protein product [Thlaspi arvense]|uniref:Uncharacterized protein n=1 Tax=Thlaspi arvense TaxID=13288 RepID=A0AAU9RQ75_THLAR|nr:unnamed protein product [Thlaspi arvense]
MAISISGAVLSGLSSSFLINGDKRSGVGGGAMRVGQKNVIIAPQRKKSWVMTAVKGDGNSKSKLDPEWLDDASQKASSFVYEKGSEVGHVSAEKGQEVYDHIQSAKDYFVEKAGEAMDTVAENAQRASDFVTEKAKEMEEEAVSMTEKTKDLVVEKAGETKDFIVEKTGEAKDFIVEKTGEAKEFATEMSKKTAKYVGELATEAKEAILPPKDDVLEMSISGAVLNGMGSSFLINGGKRSGVGGGAMNVGRKNVIIAPQRKKLWVPTAVKGDGNSKNDPKWLDDASQKAAEFVKEKGSEVGHVSAQKGQEVKDHMERARNYFVEKAGEAMDNVAENAKRASEFVTEKGKETKKETVSATEKAKDFIIEKAGEAKDSATEMRKKTAKYVGDKATEAKEAILPPKNEK